MTASDEVILETAKKIQEEKGYVTVRCTYAALPGTTAHRKGRREPSLVHISRVLTANGYRPVGKTRGGYTHYRKEGE